MMAHIRKELGFPAYQVDEQGNPISPTGEEDYANPLRHRVPSAPGQGQEGRQSTLFDMLQRPETQAEGTEGGKGQGSGSKEEKLKEKIRKKMGGGSREEPPATTAPDEKKVDPQLLSRGSQLKATAGSKSYAKGGPK